MYGAPEFGADFQRVLVRAAIDDAGLRVLVSRFADLGQLSFSDPAASWAWRIVAGGMATVLTLETEAARLSPVDPAHAGVAAITQSADIRSREYVRQQIVEWARRQTFQAGFEEARAAWNHGKHAEAYDLLQRRMSEIAAIRLDSADRGWFFEDLEERQQRRAVTAAGLDVWSTGIDGLDVAMGGGIRYGDLVVPLAYSGIGKTFFCVQIGYVTTRSRGRVLHYVLEGGRAKTEDRYEARWAETAYRDVRAGSISPASLRIMEREYALMHHNLVIRGVADVREWHASIDFIQSELDTLRAEYSWVPDVIVIDYGDLVWAPGNDELERQKTAFQQMKTLAGRAEYRGHRGYAVVAPSQAQRPDQGADEREHIIRPRAVADCYAKVKIADAVVSINITLLEKQHRQARVSLGKYRDDEDGGVWRVTTDYAHGGFSVLGAPEPPALPPARPPGSAPPPPPPPPPLALPKLGVKPLPLRGP